jgi:hypothetical protein
MATGRYMLPRLHNLNLNRLEYPTSISLKYFLYLAETRMCLTLSKRGSNVGNLDLQLETTLVNPTAMTWSRQHAVFDL